MDQSHADKLNYPSDTDKETGITALARAHIALAKDANAANRQQSSYSERSYRISFWIAVWAFAYTVVTAVILVFSIVQYGETHRFNKKQTHFFADQVGIMRRQLDAMEAEERPWIAAPKIQIEWQPIDSPARVNFSFTFRNVGKTPTIGLYIGAVVSPGETWQKESNSSLRKTPDGATSLCVEICTMNASGYAVRLPRNCTRQLADLALLAMT